MRLHSLEMTAFGPFGKTERVDFDALGADGLFLLHGKTGAGKTTILDAVAFALYGVVPGARREGKRLLSDHAESGVAPSVTLEASLGGRRVRIVRSPEYFRPKKRGTGTTKQNAKASLTWLDGTGQNLTRLDEIGEQVGAALGMSADQFFQVVLLPQGEFARFLRADSEERGTLLERLFDTARFGDVEQWFAERRRLSGAELESSSRAIDKLVGKIATAAGEPEQLDRPPVEWATELLESGRGAYRSAIDVLATARASSASAVGALRQLDTTATLQGRRDKAKQQLADFHQSAAERATVRRELDRSVAAGPVASMAQECAAAATAHSAAVRSVIDAHRTLESLDGSDVVLAELDSTADVVDAVAERAVVAAAVRQWTTELSVLEELRTIERRADAEDRTVRELSQQHDAVARKIEALAIARDALPAALASAELAVSTAVHAAAQIQTLQDRSARIAEAVRAAIELTKKRSALGKAEKALESARTTHNDARERLLDLREQRLSGMAAELAAGLVDGQPCGVCGSAAHPNPAQPAETTVTKADEEAAAKAERATATTVDTRAAEVAALLRAIDGLIQTSGDRDSAHLASELDEATAALTAARTDADALDARRRHLESLRTEDQRIAAAVAEQQSTAAGIVARREQVMASVQQMRARVREAVGNGESLDRRTHRLEALIARSTALLDARIASGTTSERARTLDDRLDRYVAESGFTSAQEALDAVVPQDRAAQIEKRLKDADGVRAHAEQVLVEPAIATLAADPVDIEPARAAMASAAAELDAAVARHAECKRRTEEVEALTAQLWAAVDRSAPMQAKHDELAALADVVAGRGQNARKMSLRSYVLASRLEDVAESASIRLHRMSSGRYEFVHSDEAESRGRRGGLGLDIRDDYTGVVRSAKTLSGGESFLASLALALGLADVVAAESGGVVLDTMFIDEGFGTLDAETLESVMGVLDELRAGGRVVGIVSHVDEMRQRIPSRLHVVREREGSRIQLFAAS